jgi:hypothetical protein
MSELQDMSSNIPGYENEFFGNISQFGMINAPMISVPPSSSMLPMLEIHHNTIDPSLILMSQTGELYPSLPAYFEAFSPQSSWTEDNLWGPMHNMPLSSKLFDAASQFDKSYTPPSDTVAKSPDEEDIIDHKHWYPSPDRFTSPESAWGDSKEADSPNSPESDFQYSVTEAAETRVSEPPPPLDPKQAQATAARRQWEDSFIVEGRRKGWTYKEIIVKGRFKCAESTIRGRYRSIIKPKSERLRRPIWKPIDEQLLLDAVERMSSKDRIRRVTAKDNMQELAVVWLEVSNYIKEHGGTYKFGPWTCKQKWMQLAGITE